jgi:hypothetical protein
MLEAAAAKKGGFGRPSYSSISSSGSSSNNNNNTRSRVSRGGRAAAPSHGPSIEDLAGLHETKGDPSSSDSDGDDLDLDTGSHV